MHSSFFIMHGVPFGNPSEISTLTVSSEGRYTAKQRDFDNPLVVVLSIGTFERMFSFNDTDISPDMESVASTIVFFQSCKLHEILCNCTSKHQIWLQTDAEAFLFDHFLARSDFFSAKLYLQRQCVFPYPAECN